jgi:hypothetical protein
MYTQPQNSLTLAKHGKRLGDASTDSLVTSVQSTFNLSPTMLALILLGGGLLLGFMLQPKVAAAKRKFHSAAHSDFPAWKVALLTVGVGLAAGYAVKQGWIQL